MIKPQRKNSALLNANAKGAGQIFPYGNIGSRKAAKSQRKNITVGLIIDRLVEAIHDRHRELFFLTEKGRQSK